MEPDFYPVQKQLGDGVGSNDKSVLLVDVGGGMGHDLEELKAKHPELKGRLVLQDRPEVINKIEGPIPAIEPTVHDFFTPQPVKGKPVAVITRCLASSVS